jgi:hypothetical protein
MHRSPLRVLTRQHPPLAAAFKQVKHATENIIQINGSRLSLLAYAFQQGTNLFEGLSAEVTGVCFSHKLNYKTNK